MQKKELKLSNGERLTYQKLFLQMERADSEAVCSQIAKEYCHASCFPTRCARKVQIHFGMTKRGYGWVSSMVVLPMSD